MAAKSASKGSAPKNQGKPVNTQKWWQDWRRWRLLGIPVVVSAVMFGAGIIFWGGFNTAMEATNTLGFCISCHEMENTVYQEYKSTIHFQNRTGVRATCSDCHVPDPWVHKVVRKIEATRELYHKAMGSIDTPEKFEKKRLKLAKRVWKSMKKTDSRECRNCHNFQSMNPEFQRPRARKQHMNAFTTGQTCIDCHKGIAHKNVRDKLDEAELEQLEKPNPLAIRHIPQSFHDGMKRAEEKEAAIAAKEAAMMKAAAKTASAPAAAGAGEGPASPIDWSGVEAKTVTLFYPGQASFEWVQTGKDHGGARAFKTGDRCAFCHLKEVKDMGAKIVSGKKVEPTPIPGKRGHIDVSTQAAHDGENLYFRFSWKNPPHTPAPFVDGGKMDKTNQTKLAVMIAGKEIEGAELAGCWVSCHSDSRYMRDHPKKEAIEAAPEAAGRLDLSAGMTKYLAESRTEMEVRGRRGAKRGGWDKLKTKDEVAALAKAGTFMDLIRFRSGDKAENGSILEQRVMTGGVDTTANGVLTGDTWSVVMSRPLKPGKPGDIDIEAGKIYTIGIAIHDDHTTARFHHVSLEYQLGLDNAEAEINAVKK
jgi:cytochrome c-type protein NapC